MIMADAKAKALLGCILLCGDQTRHNGIEIEQRCTSLAMHLIVLMLIHSHIAHELTCMRTLMCNKEQSPVPSGDECVNSRARTKTFESFQRLASHHSREVLKKMMSPAIGLYVLCFLRMFSWPTVLVPVRMSRPVAFQTAQRVSPLQSKPVN